MKANQIRVGGVYVAKVSGKLTEVRVDEIYEGAWLRYSGGKSRTRTVYHVTNLRTQRKLTFRSAQKFRSFVRQSNG